MDKSTLGTLLDPKRIKKNLEAHIRASKKIRARREEELEIAGLSQKMPLALERKLAAMTATKKKK